MSQTECKICNQNFKNSLTLTRHLWAAHKITSKEYTIQYLFDGKQPKCKECGAETRYVQFSFKPYCKEHSKVARAKACKSVGKLPSWNKGKTKKDSELLEKQSKAFKGKGNPFYGKKHSRATLAKLRKNKKVSEKEYYSRLLKRCTLPKEKESKEFVLLTDYREYFSRQHQHLLLRCTKCQKENRKTLQAFERDSKCIHCFPVQKYSREETKVRTYVKSISKGVRHNVRSIITPLELDIYVPEQKFAIEYNGLHWHSEEHKEKKYHKNKTQLCEANGVQLFHVFSDEWREKEEIVKSMIAYRLGKLTNSIGARQCVVRELTSKEAREFFTRTHISGWTRSRVIFGLVDKTGRIVSALGLRVPTQKKKYPGLLEISRFSNELNLVVHGSFTKLLKVAKEYAMRNGYGGLVTYADLRFGKGEVYVAHGFEYVGDTALDYWYTDGVDRFNRFTYRAQDGKTEKQIVEEAGVFRVYGCGSAIFRMML